MDLALNNLQQLICHKNPTNQPWRKSKTKICTKMQGFFFNKFWKQHLTKQQLYGHLSLISQTISSKINIMLDTAGGSKDNNNKATFSRRLLHIDTPVFVDQQWLTYRISLMFWSSTSIDSHCTRLSGMVNQWPARSLGIHAGRPNKDKHSSHCT